MSWDDEFAPKVITDIFDEGIGAFLCTDKKYLVYYIEAHNIISLYMQEESFTREKWNDLYDEIKAHIHRTKSHPKSRHLSSQEDLK